MRKFELVVVVFAALLPPALAACGHGNDAKTGAGSNAQTTPTTTPGSDTTPGAGSGSQVADTPPPKPVPPPEPPPPPGHDFTPTGKTLLVVGACGDGPTPPDFSEAMIKKHCEVIKKAQDDYKDKWLKLARPFFTEKVPGNLPKKVVYPFAGGDLSTALTVFPDADEITTMSLEPAGDPRTLAALNVPPAPEPEKPVGKGKAPPKAKGNAALERALGTVQYELKFLYRVNFSNTANMITAMRGGTLPTQLIFGLSALKVHGYEVATLRYFKLDDAGTIQYLTDDEVAKAPDPTKGRAETRNALFANAEIRFKKPGGRIQIYRHIQVNLDDAHIKKDPRVLKHLESKGPIASMTKAASYLLSWDSFSMMRNYLTKNTQWMVSDATGVAPKWGKPAGFEYETYGTFNQSHLPEGNSISANWREEWKAQSQRALAFRFGYYDKATRDHLVIMKKKT